MIGAPRYLTARAPIPVSPTTMRYLATLLLTAVLASCTASYDSPRTGIKYRVEVPFSAVEKFVKPPIQVTLSK